MPRIFIIAVFVLAMICPAFASDEALTAEEVQILDQTPSVTGITECNIILPNEEKVAIFMMEVDPQHAFDPDCGSSCAPLPVTKDWPSKVHDKLIEKGCGEDLIAQKLPQILKRHCDMGLYHDCDIQGEKQNGILADQIRTFRLCMGADGCR